jgi:hypothetical protein
MNSLFRRLCYEQDGQVLYLAAATLVVVLGMAALSIDIGYALHAQRELQSCADSAASAGGSAMPNGNVVSPTTVADEYSGDSSAGGIYNIHHDLNITNVTVNYACVTGSVATNLNMPPCATYSTLSSTPGCTSGCNAIQVIETAAVPTFFAKIFGITTINITATASASASGALPIPYHIMMVLDSTNSMGTTNDTGCLSTAPGTTYTAEQCAQYGIQTMLSGLAPCATNLASCSGAAPVDQVGLMTFPGLCDKTAAGETTSNCNPTNYLASSLNDTTANSTYAPDDYNCSGTNPPIAAYNNDPEYLINGFGTDYRLSDTAGLNSSSDIVKSTDAGAGGCGIQTPGGMNTFYAGVIVAAQQYLMVNHTSGIQDIMIMLSDGNANASGSTGDSGGSHMAGSVKQTVSLTGMSGNLWQGTNDCAQAVAAADWAKGYKESDGTYTEIYSISYNSANVQCSNDTTSITDCQTMQDIGSAPSSQYFFSVPIKTGGTTCSGAVPITYLDQVFTTILGDLLSSRLIPNTDF